MPSLGSVCLARASHAQQSSALIVQAKLADATAQTPICHNKSVDRQGALASKPPVQPRQAIAIVWAHEAGRDGGSVAALSWQRKAELCRNLAVQYRMLGLDSAGQVLAKAHLPAMSRQDRAPFEMQS